jgi:hypothetical protein
MSKLKNTIKQLGKTERLLLFFKLNVNVFTLAPIPHRHASRAAIFLIIRKKFKYLRGAGPHNNHKSLKNSSEKSLATLAPPTTPFDRSNAIHLTERPHLPPTHLSSCCILGQVIEGLRVRGSGNNRLDVNAVPGWHEGEQVSPYAMALRPFASHLLAGVSTKGDASGVGRASGRSIGLWPWCVSQAAFCDQDVRKNRGWGCLRRRLPGSAGL